MPAWKTHAGVVTFDPRERAGSKEELQIPCGTCIGCTKSKAQAWALRCLLEAQEHDSATFTTLTYEPGKEPTTGLSRRDIQLFYKRLRKKSIKPFRHFTAGEYGETTNRPHYHAILFGLESERDRVRIENAWAKGHTYTVPVTARAISYTAGYCAKKYDRPDRNKPHYELQINYETGEETRVLTYQPPFLQMSRGGRNGHGIGGKSRRHTQSWKDFGIINGTRIPVPEYLHSAWEEAATGDEIEQHEHEKYLRKLTKERITTERLEATELIEKSKQRLQSERRKI